MKQVIGVDTFKNSSTPFFLFCFLKTKKKLSGSSVTEREINAQLEQAPVESRLKPRRCSLFLHLPPPSPPCSPTEWGEGKQVRVLHKRLFKNGQITNTHGAIFCFPTREHERWSSDGSSSFDNFPILKSIAILNTTSYYFLWEEFKK